MSLCSAHNDHLEEHSHTVAKPGEMIPRLEIIRGAEPPSGLTMGHYATEMWQGPLGLWALTSESIVMRKTQVFIKENEGTHHVGDS